MKKLLPLLLVAALSGCAGAQKVTDGLTQVNKTLDQVAQTADHAATAVNTTLNSVDKTMDRVQGLQADAQRLATRVEGLPHYDRHVVVKGDTLWRYSRKTYKTGFLWPFIAEQNGLPDGNRIKVGDVVRVAPADMLSTYSADELDRYRQLAYKSK